MRNAFVRALVDIARHDERIFLLVGDLGYSAVEPFAKEYPQRFVNMGVAEQNMTGVAAGLALSGKIVFTYSIANFPTLRCLEQIRNDVCYHNADVKIVAVGAGLSYGALGMTHHATEDIAILRALPNMKVICPADPVEAELATHAVAQAEGPAYLRLAKAGEPLIHANLPTFEIGRAIELRPGRDIVLLATGTVVKNALGASAVLAHSGIAAGVYSVHTLKPIDEDLIRQLAITTPVIVTIEEHSRFGGLGTSVAEVLAEIPQVRCLLRRISLPGSFFQEAGSQEYLRAPFLSVEALVMQVREVMAGTTSS